jgi:outer membrane protein assembly factor BamB
VSLSNRHGLRFTALIACAAIVTILSSQAPALAAAPTISGFHPGRGAAGTKVTIKGSGFAATTAVKFHGVADPSFRVHSDNKITAHVPWGASTGKITVVTTGGSAKSSGRFTVLPSIDLTPTVGPPTSTVTVDGAGFTAGEADDLYFDSSDEALASAGASGTFSGATLTVPASAVPGTHWVTAVGRHAGLSAQAPFTVRTDWPQFHYSASRQGLNPFENVLSTDTVPGIGLDWTYTTGDDVSSSPAVANGLVYVGVDNGLYAVNASTGELLWSYPTGGGIAFFSPAVANGVVYVGSYGDDKVYALKASTGELLWSYVTGTVESSPAVANGVVYVGSYSDRLYALDASTGGLLWSYTTGDIVESSPAVANGVVYVASRKSLYALNASTGDLLWSYPTGGYVYSSPAIAKGVVYVGSGDGKLYALNASTGGLLWADNGGFDYSSPAVANGVVYDGSISGKLFALDAWTGKPLWSYVTGGVIDSPPAVANGVVYVASRDGKLYALDASTGGLLWADNGGFDYSSPAIANGVVCIGSSNGRLYAFDLPAGASGPSRPNPATLNPDLALRAQRWR